MSAHNAMVGGLVLLIWLVISFAPVTLPDVSPLVLLVWIPVTSVLGYPGFKNLYQELKE